MSYFFEGLPQPGPKTGGEGPDEDAEGAIRAFLTTPEGLELARRFPLIPKGRLRKQVLELVRALSDEPETVAEMVEPS